jgi:hypothetical protein
MPRLPLRVIFLSVQLAASVCARPSLPEPPLGTASASFAGGGVAHSAGVGSLFINPAALSVRDAFQAEAGLMGLSSGLSPYALFGAPAGERASYALGYWYDARPGDVVSPQPPREGLVAGAAWDAAPWASTGALIKSAGTGDGIGEAGFGIDADVGALARPWKAVWLGLVLHDAMESGVGQEPDGFRTHRSYGFSLGTGIPGFRFAGIEFLEPDAYYELRSQGLAPDARLAHAFSAASSFFPEGRLGFRGTLDLPQGGTPGFAWGTFLNLPLGNGALAVAYVIHTGGSPETGESETSHSLSLNFRMGGRLDPLPPSVEVAADKADLVPGDSAGELFRLSARDLTYVRGRSDSPDTATQAGWAGRRRSLDEGRSLAEGSIRAWNLGIRGVGKDGLAGPLLRTFKGKELPPRIIRWDGEDDSGRALPPGFYAYRLEAEDAAGNAAATAWQLVRIAPAPPPGSTPSGSDPIDSLFSP